MRGIHDNEGGGKMNYSPLRYPGGKSKISPFVRFIIENNMDAPVTYIEPFAGGAGVALNLLIEGTVNHIVINDYDKAIYSFWRAVKEEPEKLIQMISYAPLTIDEWKKQKNIYCTQNKKYSVDLGFAAFYLNRTNRSGILSAGPIGGYDQTGNYGLNARFNREILIEKIRLIARFQSRITVYNKEIQSFIKNIIPKYSESAFVYFDPPYYEKGQRLYKNFFSETDHVELAKTIVDEVECPWIITYDDVPELRRIYSDFEQRRYSLNYSVANKGKASEIIIFKTPDLLPKEDELKNHIKNFELTEA